MVHHWADRNEIVPVEPAHNSLRRAWGLGRKFVIGYSGNFGRAHEFQTVLDAAERLKHMKSIVFLMIGEGQQRGFVESEVRRRGLTNVMMKPFQPVEKLSESLGAANVHLVSLKPELEHCIVPSKFYGVLAAARPTIFIGDTEGEIGTIVRDFQCGMALRPGDVDALVDAILHLRHSPVGRMSMGNNARYLMETAYSREYGAAVWQSAISRLEEKWCRRPCRFSTASSSRGNCDGRLGRCQPAWRAPALCGPAHFRKQSEAGAFLYGYLRLSGMAASARQRSVQCAPILGAPAGRAQAAGNPAEADDDLSGFRTAFRYPQAGEPDRTEIHRQCDLGRAKHSAGWWPKAVSTARAGSMRSAAKPWKCCRLRGKRGCGPLSIKSSRPARLSIGWGRKRNC